MDNDRQGETERLRAPGLRQIRRKLHRGSVWLAYGGGVRLYRSRRSLHFAGNLDHFCQRRCLAGIRILRMHVSSELHGCASPSRLPLKVGRLQADKSGRESTRFAFGDNNDSRETVHYRACGTAMRASRIPR
jgi:hypothetical protein